MLAFGAPAGAVVDRHPRRRVMITADLARAAPAVLMSQATAIPAIYALVFGLALGGVFDGAAYQSLVPAVVPARILGRANALTWSTVQSTRVLGAALGGSGGPREVAGGRASGCTNRVEDDDCIVAVVDDWAGRPVPPFPGCSWTTSGPPAGNQPARR